MTILERSLSRLSFTLLCRLVPVNHFKLVVMHAILNETIVVSGTFLFTNASWKVTKYSSVFTCRCNCICSNEISNQFG